MRYEQDFSFYATGHGNVTDGESSLSDHSSPELGALRTLDSMSCPRGTPPEEELKSNSLAPPLQDTQDLGQLAPGAPGKD